MQLSREYTLPSGEVIHVFIIYAGGWYGLNECLHHVIADKAIPEYAHTDSNGVLIPLIEFHSKDYFISRYYWDTLKNSKNAGICLDGSLPEFNIDEKTYNQIRNDIDVIIESTKLTQEAINNETH